MERFFAGASALAVATCGAAAVHAHGIAGDRVFPATIVIDDPAVADEVSLPTISTIHNSASPGGPGSRQVDYAAEFDKRITEDLGFDINVDYTTLYFDGGGSQTGWQNPVFTLKYHAYTNDEHEFMLSVGLVRQFGGTGSAAINNPIGSTTPTVYYGKGLGDLLTGYLRPLAITGELQYQVSDQPEVKANQWIIGASVQYSIPYLQQHVKHLDLPEFVGRLLPIVEMQFTVPANGAAGGAVTGTIAPGILYLGDAWQFGIEALIPATKANHTGTGVIAQMHFFLDDIFPTTIGKPIFGGNP